MTTRTSKTCALALALLLIGAGCGSSDGDAFGDVAANSDTVENGASDPEAMPDGEAAAAGDGTAPGFGELIEGTFLLSGATNQEFRVSDDQYAFRTTGGCQGGGYGFGVQVNNAAATATLATFGVQGQVDFSGGLTGEFDDVDFEAAIFAEGDMTDVESYSGTVKMIVSEHDTGGVDSDLNARRMTITLLGSVPSDAGDVGVDITYRWVMGCP